MKILILISFFITSLSFSQILDNSLAQAFTDKPFFNKEFIKSNKIRLIKGHVSTKASMDYIRKNDLIQVFKFDTLGQVIAKYETINILGSKDTIINFYDYNEKGLLITHRKTDRFGFYATHYSYDSLQRVVRTEYRRDMNKGRDPFNFQLGKSFMINFETSEYAVSDGLVKRTYYNNYGKPFQETFFY